MKLTWNLKKHLLPVCLVLAFALLLGLTLNLYKPLKQLTQKKVPNPENLLNVDRIILTPHITKNGITTELNDDGSIHVFGKSTTGFTLTLTFESFLLEKGKSYIFSSGMKRDGLYSYNVYLSDINNIRYAGTLDPGKNNPPFKDYRFGSFVCPNDEMEYNLCMTICNAGAVIDEVIYPCLVEGTEPGDFYIYK